MTQAVVKVDAARTLAKNTFKLTAVGLTIKANTPFSEWIVCGQALKQMQGATQWWIGDWLAFGEGKYGDTYTEAEEQTGFAYDTLAKNKLVAQEYQIGRRRPNLSWSHHRELLGLSPAEQDEWLDLCEEHGWSRAELRRQIKKATPIDPLPEGIFDVFYADPPWEYDNSELGGAAQKHYKTMNIEAICQMEVAGIVADNAVLFLWATNPLLPEALRVMGSWGFNYKTNICWVKEGRGTYGELGFYVSGGHELLLLGTRGSMLPEGDKPLSVIRSLKGKHSKKPNCVYGMIERMYPRGRCFEIFARNTRQGWEVWGDEV